MCVLFSKRPRPCGSDIFVVREEGDLLRTGRGRDEPEMRIGRAGEKTAAWRALYEALLEQERLDHILDGVAGLAERGRDGLDADRPTAERFCDQPEIALVEGVEA